MQCRVWGAWGRGRRVSRPRPRRGLGGGQFAARGLRRAGSYTGWCDTCGDFNHIHITANRYGLVVVVVHYHGKRPLTSAGPRNRPPRRTPPQTRVVSSQYRRREPVRCTRRAAARHGSTATWGSSHTRSSLSCTKGRRGTLCRAHSCPPAPQLSGPPCPSRFVPHRVTCDSRPTCRPADRTRAPAGWRTSRSPPRLRGGAVGRALPAIIGPFSEELDPIFPTGLCARYR